MKGTEKKARESKGHSWDCKADLSPVKESKMEGGWAGRVPDYSAAARSSWPGQWEVMKPKVPIRGNLQRRGCVSPSLCSVYWLRGAYGK